MIPGHVSAQRGDQPYDLGEGWILPTELTKLPGNLVDHSGGRIRHSTEETDPVKVAKKEPDAPVTAAGRIFYIVPRKGCFVVMELSDVLIVDLHEWRDGVERRDWGGKVEDLVVPPIGVLKLVLAIDEKGVDFACGRWLRIAKPQWVHGL